MFGILFPGLGSAVDTAETLEMTGVGQIGELQSKPKDTRKVHNIPNLKPPECLESVLVALEQNPVGDIEPSAQHKKNFKLAKANQEAASKGDIDGSMS